VKEDRIPSRTASPQGVIISQYVTAASARPMEGARRAGEFSPQAEHE
jgi:hypothetical protein